MRASSRRWHAPREMGGQPVEAAVVPVDVEQSSTASKVAPCSAIVHGKSQSSGPTELSDSSIPPTARPLLTRASRAGA